MRNRAIPERPRAEIAVQYACDANNLPARADFARWARGALEDRPGALCVRIVDEAEGRALNHRYRQKDYATNVLSFPGDAPLLGDIALCAPVVACEAARQSKSLHAHYAHLTVHGVLHLLGHGHERDAEAQAMEALERRILDALGFPDPYAGDTLEPGHANEESR